MPRKRRSYPAEPEGEGCVGGASRGSDDGRTGGPLRCASEPDWQLEAEGSADGAGRLFGRPRSRSCGRRSVSASSTESFYPRPSVGEPRPERRDGRSHPRPAQHRPAVPLGLGRTLVVLLRGHGREPVEPAPAAGDRRAVFGDAVLRLAADDPLAPPSGRHGLAQTGAPPNATAGGARDLPTAQDVSGGPGAQGLSLPVTRSADHATEPRVVHGCYPISHYSEAFCTSSR